MRRRDISKALLASATGSTLLTQQAEAQTCSLPCFPQTSTESAAGATVADFSIASYDKVGCVIVDRYGVNTTPGTTDMTTAIQKAIAVCPEGGTVQFLNAIYKYSSIGISKAVTLKGVGFYGISNDGFGNSSWNSNIFGSVLRSTKTTNGSTIEFSDATHVKRFCIKDLAIIGPGSGMSTGVSYGNSAVATVQGQLHGVLIANFFVGLHIMNSYEIEGIGLCIRGCTTGMTMPTDAGGGLCSDSHFYRCEFQTCTVGTKLELATGISFHGCLWQNCATGLLMQAKAAGGVGHIVVHGWSWFENAGGTDIELDSTNGALKHIVFSQCRLSTGVIRFTGTQTINYLHFGFFSGGGVSLTLPSHCQNVTMLAAEFASITDNSQFGVLRLDDSTRRT